MHFFIYLPLRKKSNLSIYVILLNSHIECTMSCYLFWNRMSSICHRYTTKAAEVISWWIPTTPYNYRTLPATTYDFSLSHTSRLTAVNDLHDLRHLRFRTYLRLPEPRSKRRRGRGTGVVNNFVKKLCAFYRFHLSGGLEIQLHLPL